MVIIHNSRFILAKVSIRARVTAQPEDFLSKKLQNIKTSPH